MHRGSHHLNLSVQGKFGSGVPGGNTFHSPHCSPSMIDDTRKALRTSLRQARQAMSPAQQNAAAENLFKLLTNQDFFRAAQRVAFYHPADAEIDPGLLLELALSEGKSCFLPVLSKDNPDFVSFSPYDASTELVENQYGIPEPVSREITVPPTNFDVVFVPLVGFSADCSRLGMGKGYYDRSFSFKISNRHSRPLLVGLAHESQLVDSIPVQSWDVRLDAIATDEKIYRPDTA